LFIAGDALMPNGETNTEAVLLSKAEEKMVMIREEFTLLK
jgi:hypothetical protein